jgi:2-oxoisovalerate dehydrogenase E1 component
VTASLSPVDAYLQMATIRAFELRCQELSLGGEIDGSIHLCVGQEAIPVGAMAALTDQDRISVTYRGHGWAIASGIPLDAVLGEVGHRTGGINGGRGGSAHLTSPRHRFFGENSIVGAGVPIGAGLALASKATADGGIALVSVGDGAMNQGATHEGLVFAAALGLPLVLVCENNGWSEMTPISSMLEGSLHERIKGYGIRSMLVDGGDPAAVAAAITEAAGHARDGHGPVFLECTTVRMLGHYNRDIEHYRPKEDKESATAADPLVRLRAELESKGTSAGVIEELDRQAAAAIEVAVAQVRAMSYPDPATASEHLYAPPATSYASTDPVETVELTYQRAANRALSTELAARPELLVYGEDVGVAGGIFGVTRSLQRNFGPERVFDTPIAESAILGSAVGAAMAGMRPVVEIMWADFLLVALDQIVNQAANVRYISRGEASAPMVIRTQQGATPGSCAQHSQSLEALLAHIPGIKVGLPATPQDAFAMLRAAIADDDPCILFEARSLYQVSAPVVVSGETEPAAGARLRRDGDDIVIITWGTMLAPALDAAEQLRNDGIDAAVLDLRWLQPLDVDQINELVRRCGRAVVAHEANQTGGFGAEIAARIQQDHFDVLQAPVYRVGARDSRLPAAPALQGALLPGVADIVAACAASVGSLESARVPL